ncbi:uncharacterized protein LOC134537844 [Bacillus rossius redtenbacheri]|uniref:uncharacterized protein LOC134537844 n=1 Tax=Bacillus rossius redtenbacheri TaxID=93214 RepID=UPI002FDD948F
MSFLKLARSNLKNYSLNEDETVSGFFESKEAYDRFCNELKAAGYSFSIRDSEVHAASSENINEPNFYFKYHRGINVPKIDFFGAPFSIEKRIFMQCSQGPKYYCSRQTSDQLSDHPISAKRRFCMHNTKKLGCPAFMSVNCVRVYEEYSAPDHKLKKRSMVKKLKGDWEKKTTLTSHLRWYVRVSCAETHNHSATSPALTQKIHTDVATEIKRLVEQGITNIKDVKFLLKQYVERKFSHDKILTSPNKAIYPEDSTIYSHVYRAMFLQKRDQIDQELLQKTISEWKIKNSEDCFFFRPYADVADGDAPSPLLFCHQTKWQQKMLLRYGGVCLLDATYKTTKYALPLFFLAVKTNVDYIVVGTFVVQSESTALIAEALNVFRKWLPEWQSQFWMTDFSEMEINAIESAFPKNTVYLCAFHREQAWLRWVRKSGNVTSGAEEILSTWRAIAASRNEHEFELNVQIMNCSNVMQQNPKASCYFASHWLPHKHRWVQAFGEKDFVTIIHANNGIESQNKVLKHSYLCNNSDKSLTGMLKIVINNYLPDAYKKYCSENSIKEFNSDIPSYLMNRPQHFIKHVLTRISAAQYDFTKDSITEVSDGIFAVESSTDKGRMYYVNFDDASCSCMDFMTFRFPCKHMCAVFEFLPNWSFLQLNSAYITSPYITLDSENSFCTLEGFSNPSSANSTSDVTSQRTQITPDVSLPSEIIEHQQNFREKLYRLIDLSYVCEDSTFLCEATMFAQDRINEMEKKSST